MFEVPIGIVGKYTIIFNNRMFKINLLVTFTMNNNPIIKVFVLKKKIKEKDLTITEQN